MKEVVNVLWTGGLDSTSRIAELSKLDVVIKPYYIVDNTRGSIKQEINAMKEITEIIRKEKTTKAILEDVTFVDDSSINENFAITKAWKSFNKKYLLGSQYDYLARFAKQNNLILEVGLESSPRSKAANTIINECTLCEYISHNGIKHLYIDQKESSPEAVLLFGNIRLPSSIWNMTKLEEVEFIKSLGLEEVILKTWFCHRPIFGYTCGHCNPCKDALNEGMAFRVSKFGYVLGLLRNVYNRCKGILK